MIVSQSREFALEEIERYCFVDDDDYKHRNTCPTYYQPLWWPFSVFLAGLLRNAHECVVGEDPLRSRSRHETHSPSALDVISVNSI